MDPEPHQDSPDPVSRSLSKLSGSVYHILIHIKIIRSLIFGETEIQIQIRIWDPNRDAGPNPDPKPEQASRCSLRPRSNSGSEI